MKLFKISFFSVLALILVLALVAGLLVSVIPISASTHYSGSPVQIQRAKVHIEITYTDPVQGAVNVPLDSRITIGFNRSVDTKLVERAFTLFPGTKGSFAWNPNCTEITFTPSSDLKTGTVYGVSLSSTALLSSSGSNTHFLFRTSGLNPLTESSKGAKNRGKASIQKSDYPTRQIIKNELLTGTQPAPTGNIILRNGIKKPSNIQATIINFPDSGLESAIRIAINKPSGSIYQFDLDPLTSLDASGFGISDLTGIQHCAGLTKLNLRDNNIADISPLSSLISIYDLDLGFNQISDISDLTGLVLLIWLSIDNNQITDISGLTAFSMLSWLVLDHNQISNLSGLSLLSGLLWLVLDNNHISNLSALTGLTNLSWLSLDTNQITDVSPLASLNKLFWLDLGFNQISDIAGLAGLTGLQNLFLWENQITDISSLESLTGLLYLYLNNNRISAISALEGLTNLEDLSLSANQISAISTLAFLTNLHWLHLSNNQISDTSALEGLTNLELLALDQNHVTAISSLVANSGLGSGDTIKLAFNNLDLTPGSSNMLDIQTLIGRGAEVDYQPQNEVTVNIVVVLQGSSRPDNGWIVPLTVKFFSPGTVDVLTAEPLITCDLITSKDGNTAVAPVLDIPLGTYDITVSSLHCLTNVKRGVVISGLFSDVAMGALSEGNADNDHGIDIQDFDILAAAFGKSTGDSGYNVNADFDRSGRINIADFALLASNYGQNSPIEVD